MGAVTVGDLLGLVNVFFIPNQDFEKLQNEPFTFLCNTLANFKSFYQSFWFEGMPKKAATFCQVSHISLWCQENVKYSLLIDTKCEVFLFTVFSRLKLMSI